MVEPIKTTYRFNWFWNTFQTQNDDYFRERSSVVTAFPASAFYKEMAAGAYFYNSYQTGLT